MSAKKSPAQPNPQGALAATQASVATSDAGGAAEAAVSWYDSSDPRKRLIARIILVVVWIYVAALCLLALDQWFNWGIFGPKIPPTP